MGSIPGRVKPNTMQLALNNVSEREWNSSSTPGRTVVSVSSCQSFFFSVKMIPKKQDCGILLCGIQSDEWV